MNAFASRVFASFAAEFLEPDPNGSVRSCEIAALTPDWVMREKTIPLPGRYIGQGMLELGATRYRDRRGVVYRGFRLRQQPETA